MLLETSLPKCLHRLERRHYLLCNCLFAAAGKIFKHGDYLILVFVIVLDFFDKRIIAFEREVTVLKLRDYVIVEPFSLDKHHRKLFFLLLWQLWLVNLELEDTAFLARPFQSSRSQCFFYLLVLVHLILFTFWNAKTSMFFENNFIFIPKVNTNMAKENKYKTYGHAKTRLRYHLIFSTKFRKKCLS